jgi:5-oxoprolinase (ATP-hydrolysing)/N-methylhydantoinase A
MIEIGAGGGSIAWIDGLGLLKVGPRSAGADPGPACYDQGGEEPTVTDACVVLGYFDPQYFLGGAMKLDTAAAERALAPLGRKLGLSVPEAAWGVYNVACENMAAAARRHIIEKGADPRRYPLIAFGGAGPAHASLVTRILGAPAFIIPPVSGVASALGFLVAPMIFEFSRSHPQTLRDLRWDEVHSLYAEMESQARQVLTVAGVAPADIRFQRHAEMRFSGQFHDIDVPVPDGPLTKASAHQLAERFEREYRRLYQTFLKENEPMVLNWRLRALGPEPTVRLESRSMAKTSADNHNHSSDDRQQSARQALKGYRQVYFPETGYTQVPVFDRYMLISGIEITGPGIIEERESTTVLRSGDALTVDTLGNLRIVINNE